MRRRIDRLSFIFLRFGNLSTTRSLSCPAPILCRSCEMSAVFSSLCGYRMVVGLIPATCNIDFEPPDRELTVSVPIVRLSVGCLSGRKKGAKTLECMCMSGLDLQQAPGCREQAAYT